MPSDQPRPPQRTWRTNVAGGAKANDAQPKWKRTSAAPSPAGTTWSWRTKAWIGAGFVAVVAVGLLILAKLLIPPKVPYLVLVGASYQENLTIPHNVFGRRCIDDLAKWGRDENPQWWEARHRPRVPAGELTELTASGDWRKDLEKPFKENTVVVYLALHGGADAKGAYLLTDDPKGKSRVYVSEILEQLKKLDQKKKKILILDATQMTANWPLGMLRNDFARRLRELDSQIRSDPNLVVISSSAEDQRSWVAEEVGRTIFGHAIVEGIQGVADRDSDHRVTGLELYETAAAKVQTWAKYNRHAAQTPVLLPEGDEGKKRADDIELAVVRPQDRPTDRPTFNFEIGPELTAIWNDFKARHTQPLSPATYAPHLWRQYQDTLLRYEQLVRAKGDKADAVRGRLGKLAHQIDAECRIALKNSENNALPLASSLGLASSVDFVRDEALHALWEKPSEQWLSEWEKIKAKDTRSGARLGAFLLKKALEDPQPPAPADANLTKAADMLKTLLGAGNDQPVELHYLAMLNRGDFDERRHPTPADVRDSLALRQMAEEIAWAARPDGADAKPFYPYAEAVFPWIKAPLAKADQSRRFAEDHLFGSNESSWGETRKHAQEARQSYEKAHQDARIVREAYGVRDRVMAELPYYSCWLLQEYSGDRNDAETNALRDKSLLLWDQVHLLARQFETPDPRIISEKPADRPNDISLKDRTETVRKGFEEIRNAFEQACRKTELFAHTQENWLTIQDLLAVPYSDMSVHKNLVRLSGDTSRRLNEEMPKTNEASVSDVENSHYRQAPMRQGRMALAELGRGLFDQTKAAGSDDYDTALAQLRLPDSAQHVGVAQQIGERWHSIPKRIDELTETAQKADLKAARKALFEADLLCRLLMGGFVDRLTPVASESVKELRRHRVHDLLLAQAERTVDDFWAAVGAEAGIKPYFLETAQWYVDDAKALITTRDAVSPTLMESRSADVNQLNARLKSPPVISLQGPKSGVDVTSETSIVVSNTLKTENAVPTGYPTVWVASESKELQPASADRERLADRAFLRLGDEKTSPAFDCHLQLASNLSAPLYPKPIQTKTVARGFYRGHRLRAETDVNLHLRPDVVAFREPPATGCTIAVLADQKVFDDLGGENSGIVIVLDVSGSMKGKRYTDAVAALRQVLQTLPRTTLSVWVYGQDDPKAQKVDDTIIRIQDPVVWDIKRNPRQLDMVMNKVTPLTPKYGTPLARAMWKAKDDLARIRGFKTLMVLTDGMDSEFQKDSQLNPDGKKTIRDFLAKEFGASEILVNIVGFQVEEAEQAEAIKQFNILPEFKLPGRYYTVNQAGQLAGILSAALTQQLRCRVFQFGKPVRDPGVPEDGIDVGTVESAFRPIHLKSPGVYELRVHTSTQNVELRAGDCLFVKAGMKPNGEVGFERALFAETEKFRVLKDAPKDGWLAAVLQNQLRPDAREKTDRAQRLFVTLEEAKTREPGSNGYIEQIHPHFTWFEVKAEGAKTPLALRFMNRGRYPAPAWNLDVAEWPEREATPTVHVWWLSDHTPWFFPLPSGKGKQIVNGLSDVGVQVDANEWRIESVTFEKQRTTLDGNKRPCMVVQIVNPKDKQAIASLKGFTGAEQHQVYRQANRTTSIFWDVTPDQMKQSKDMELGIISLDYVKNKQKASYAELKLDSPPSPSSQPPPELR